MSELPLTDKTIKNMFRYIGVVTSLNRCRDGMNWMGLKDNYLRERLRNHWQRIGFFRKTLELLAVLLLINLTAPSNSVKLAILLTGHPRIALSVKVSKASAADNRYLLGKYHIGRVYGIDQSYLDSSGSYEVVYFHVIRILLFNVAYSIPEPG